MKESELRKHAKCSRCGELIGASGLPLFWTVTISRWGIDMNALRRQDGLGALLRSNALASVMGTDEDMASLVSGPVELTICERCCTVSTCLAELSECAKEPK